MAKETITIKVAPEDEQSAINDYLCFGWELLTSQQVYDKDSHFESKDDKLYSVTDTTNFVRLVLTRDKNIPNYKRLCELQYDYEHVLFPDKPKTYGGVFAIIGLIMIAAIILLFTKPFAYTYLIVAALVAALVIISLIYIFALIPKISSNKKKYEEAKQIAIEEKRKIIAEAQDLC